MSAEPSLPPLRPITQIYTGALAATAVGSLLAMLLRDGLPDRTVLVTCLGLTVCVVVAMVRPLSFSFQAHVNLDTAVVVAALLILPPGHAMLVAAAGGAIAQAIARPTLIEMFFNAAQLTLQVLAGALVLAALGWHARAADFSFPGAIVATLAAGAAMFAVNYLAVGGIIGLQSRVSVIGVWYDITVRTNRVEIVAHLAQLALGLLAAVVASAESWAIALLVIPAVAVYVSLRQHVEMRRRAEVSLAMAQHLVRLGSWDWDLRTGDQRWSGELFNILGLPPEETAASTENYLAVVHEADRTAVAAALGAAVASGTPYQIDHRILPAHDGEERIVHARGEVVRGAKGRALRVVGTVHDITERKRLEQRLAHQAYHDPLTDLPNRLLFTQRLDQMLVKAGMRKELTVLFLDLDRFKLINDTFGHEAGDQLLMTVAGRLRRATRPDDVVARIGGDEFIILLAHVSTEDEAIRVATRIIDEITVPIELPGNREVVVSTSIGIVRPGPEHRTGADLIRDADNALYRAKERGRNRYALFDATMGAETQERVALEADLRRAIERDELRVYYQPKIDLASGRTVAIEAFLRWQHPARGWVSPAAFIPIAEETGLMQQIGRWVLRQACREAAIWTPAGGGATPLSVNLSGKQLHDPEFVAELEALLRETGFPPDRLRLEIAETVAMQNAEATIQALWRLHRLGVRVVIDDFGTGYSSLSSLQRFPVDTLQLDHSFVANLGRSKEATTIAQAVIGLAHGLGLKVVAEGVERREQLQQLREFGCEQAQGNLFSAPLDARALADYLRRRRIELPEPIELPDLGVSPL